MCEFIHGILKLIIVTSDLKLSNAFACNFKSLEKSKIFKFGDDKLVDYYACLVKKN